MNFETIILMVLKALNSQGKAWVESGLDKVDSVACKNPIANELYANLLIPAVKAHTVVCPPPQS